MSAYLADRFRTETVNVWSVFTPLANRHNAGMYLRCPRSPASTR